MEHKSNSQRWSDRGAMLLMVAGSLVLLLGISALSIDLVTGYLARVQCQRAADAAALAGASQFLTQACTSTGGCVPGGPQEVLATQQATAVAAQNPVMGLAPTSSTIGFVFTYPNSLEPQITVTIYRDATHQDPLPTMFAKIFGINYMNVSASATAEAYNPSGNGTPTAAGCVKPFLVPNCDPNFPVAINSPEAADHGNPSCACGGAGLANGDCAGNYGSNYIMSYYVYPVNSTTGTPGTLVHPGICSWDGTFCSGGDIGSEWVLHSSGTPSQWNTIAFGNANVTSMSANEYRDYITECAPQEIACQSTLNTLTGNKVGPTNQGIEALINAGGLGLGQGQDFMCSPTFAGGSGYCPNEPFPITPGSNNPYNMTGTFYGGPSDSIATVVVYDCPFSSDTGCYDPTQPNGVTLSPGSNDLVTVEGFMQIFIQDVEQTGGNDLVNTVVLNIAGCGGTSPSSGNGSVPPAVAPGGSPIPIRLIHN